MKDLSLGSTWPIVPRNTTDSKKGHNMSAAQEKFVEVFYQKWQSSGLGAPDYASPYPWGMPWLYSARHDLGDAEGYFEHVVEEIKRIRLSEEG